MSLSYKVTGIMILEDIVNKTGNKSLNISNLTCDESTLLDTVAYLWNDSSSHYAKVLETFVAKLIIEKYLSVNADTVDGWDEEIGFMLDEMNGSAYY